MCYTKRHNFKGLVFFQSNCFGIGFDWRDENFISAIKNRDERVFELLDWIADGNAELVNKVSEFGELVVPGREKSNLSILRDIYNFYPDESLSELLDNKFLEQRYRTVIEDYFSGELKKMADAEPREEKGERKKQSGFVYLVRAENGLYKIGKTKNITDRLKPFGVNFPMRWDLAHSFFSKDYSRVERDLHSLFEDKRKIGEWFELSDDDISQIRRIGDAQ